MNTIYYQWQLGRPPQSDFGGWSSSMAVLASPLTGEISFSEQAEARSNIIANDRKVFIVKDVYRVPPLEFNGLAKREFTLPPELRK